MNEIAEKVKGFILKECLPGERPESLKYDTPLMNSGILDSMSIVNLVAFLEKEYGIEVRSRELEPDYFGTIARVQEFVIRKRNSP